jgi:L-aminopeptidase/D-esterase-like protein
VSPGAEPARRGPGRLDDVAGIGVGHWTGAGTGVTVVLCPEGTVGSGEIRGGAPATRETALLDPARGMDRVDAVVLSGGSAFGLSTADGVMAWLVERGRGFPTRGGPVPIVPTAAIYDLVVAGDERPGPAEGRLAVEAAAASLDSGDGVALRGRAGAGSGATVGKWRGPDDAVPGGLGQASATVDGATIGALAVVNAIGDVVDVDGTVLAGSTASPDSPPFPDPEPFSPEGEGQEGGPGNTTLVVVATDALLQKGECFLLAQSGHQGMAHAVRPSHTRHDGDFVVALATGAVEGHLDRLRVAAAEVVAEAIRDAVRQTDAR